MRWLRWVPFLGPRSSSIFVPWGSGLAVSTLLWAVSSVSAGSSDGLMEPTLSSAVATHRLGPPTLRRACEVYW